MRRLALCWLWCLVFLSGCKKDVSGSYLADDKEAVCWLQLVRTPDGHLSGQVVSTVLKPDGEVEHSSMSLTGAANGENIALRGGGFLGMATTNLSGTFNGDSLTLIGVESTPVSLKRATLDDYRSKLREQTARSQAMLSARAAADARQRKFEAEKQFVADFDQLLARMQTFDAEADVHLGRFRNAEKEYEAITAKVNEYVTREQQLVGNTNRAVDRLQLVVSATQVSRDTDQMHFEGQALESSIETNIEPLVNEVTAREKGCDQSKTEGADLTPTETEAHHNACNRLLAAAPTFHQKYAAVTAGLNRLEEVYKREKIAQVKLLAEAKQIK